MRQQHPNRTISLSHSRSCKFQGQFPTFCLSPNTIITTTTTTLFRYFPLSLYYRRRRLYNSTLQSKAISVWGNRLTSQIFHIFLLLSRIISFLSLFFYTGRPFHLKRLIASDQLWKWRLELSGYQEIPKKKKLVRTRFVIL